MPARRVKNSKRRSGSHRQRAGGSIVVRSAVPVHHDERQQVVALSDRVIAQDRRRSACPTRPRVRRVLIASAMQPLFGSVSTNTGCLAR